MPTARRRAEYRDLHDLPENVIGEIIDGELHVSPRPAIPHARASSGMAGDLMGPFDRGRGGPGGWWILFEPELHLGGDVLVPDLAGWRRERVPALPPTAGTDLAPDWVCEVLSPRTGSLDRALKLPRYAAAGVSHAWLVDPLQKALEVFRLERARWTLLGVHIGDAKVRAEPFDAIELEIEGWWLPDVGPE